MKKSWRYLVAGVFVLGLILRLVGIYPGYPPDHPDEPVLEVGFSMARDRQLDPFVYNAYRFQYPGFTIYTYWAAIAGFFIPVTLAISFIQNPINFTGGAFSPGFLTTVLNGPGGINWLFWTRTLTAIVGSLSIPLVYGIGKKLFSRYAGLAAALIVAFNFRHIISSQLSLVDAPNATVALLSLLLVLIMLERPSTKTYILAAFGVGLSIATKFYLFSVVPFIASHGIISLRSKKFISSLVSPRVRIAVVVIGLTFLLFNPFLTFHLQTAIKQQSLNNLRYGFGSHALNWSSYTYLYEYGFGELPTILFFVGLFVLIKNPGYFLGGLLILLFIIPPLFVLTYYSQGGAYTRNFTSIIPFAAIIAGLGAWKIVEFIVRRNQVLILLIVTTLVSSAQIGNVLIHDYYLSLPWNRDCLVSWMEQNLNSGDIVSRTNGVALAGDKDISYIKHSNDSGRRSAFSLQELSEDGVDYLVINYTSSGYFYSDLPHNDLDNTFKGLALKELSRYSVLSCQKSWQSLDSNYAIVKIPKPWLPDAHTRFISNVASDQTDESQDHTEGRRVLGKPIPVKAGNSYIVQAKIFSRGPLRPENRDGFLRLDFFNAFPVDLRWRGQSVSISSRLTSNEPEIKQVATVAPPWAKYLVVSFEQQSLEHTFVVESVSIWSSQESPPEAYMKAAENPEVTNDILYPKFIF